MTTETDTAETPHPTPAQRKWLSRGLTQAGGKLPLFDETGRRVSHRMVHACIEHGWAEPWFANPIMPSWQICRLTQAGRDAVAERQSREPQLLL